MLEEDKDLGHPEKVRGHLEDRTAAAAAGCNSPSEDQARSMAAAGPEEERMEGLVDMATLLVLRTQAWAAGGRCHRMAAAARICQT